MGASYRFQNLVGKTYGYWKVIGLAGRSRHGNARWRCMCSAPGCGREQILFSHNLIRGRTKSCQSCRSYHKAYLSARMKAAMALLAALEKREGIDTIAEARCSLTIVRAGKH